VPWLPDLLRDGDGEAVGIEQYSELFSEVLRGRRQRELDAQILFFGIKRVEVEDLERNLRAARSCGERRAFLSAPINESTNNE